MSLWEYGACVAGFNRANSGGAEPKAAAPSYQDHLDRVRRLTGG